MICPKCGNSVAENAAFCVNCGTPVSAPQQAQVSRNAAPNYGRPAAPAAPTYDRPAAPTYDRPAAPNYDRPAAPGYGRPAAPGYGRPAAPGYGRPASPYGRRPAPAPRTLEGVPMNYFQTLMSWGIYALAAFCALVGVFYLCRWNFTKDMSDVIKYAIEGVKTMNILFGIVMILIGAAWVYVRFQLEAYRANAPKLTCLMFLVTGGAIALYRLIAHSMVASKMNDMSGAKAYSAYDPILAGLLFFVLSAIAYYVNGLYFKKRASLFTY